MEFRLPDEDPSSAFAKLGFAACGIATLASLVALFAAAMM